MKSVLVFIGLIALLILLFGKSLGDTIWSAILVVVGIIGFIVLGIIFATGFSSFADWLCDDKKRTGKKS